jgi:hypothetical protein
VKEPVINTSSENPDCKCGRSIFFFVHETADGNFQFRKCGKAIHKTLEKYFVQECGKGKT